MSLPQQVAIVGGGRMGAGIATTFALNGCHVSVLERDDESVDAARTRLERLADQAGRRNPATVVVDLLARLRVSKDFSLLGSAELVIEAVPEDFTLKTQVIQSIDLHTSSATAIATNTSSLSVSDLATNLTHPERFLGLHFFNPVPASQLIEIVVGDKTGESLVERASAWVAALDKTPIVVKDAPGFASSRLGLALSLEAMRMLEDGVASAEDIDAAMVLGYRHATGPLKTTDLVGLDVRLGVANYLESQFGERFKAPQILRDKVAAGELGRKSGKGFFDYS